MHLWRGCPGVSECLCCGRFDEQKASPWELGDGGEGTPIVSRTCPVLRVSRPHLGRQLESGRTLHMVAVLLCAALTLLSSQGWLPVDACCLNEESTLLAWYEKHASDPVCLPACLPGYVHESDIYEHGTHPHSLYRCLRQPFRTGPRPFSARRQTGSQRMVSWAVLRGCQGDGYRAGA